VHLSHCLGSARRTEGAELANGGQPGQKITHGLADAHGFSLHAAVRCGADQRKQLEQLCRYITRPALSDERVQFNAAAQVELKLKTPWRDSTTHLAMSPLAFMQSLTASKPRSRLRPRMTALRRPISALG
jgi:Putative transposase